MKPKSALFLACIVFVSVLRTANAAYTINLPVGYSLIANHLNNGSGNKVVDILSVPNPPPDGTQVFKFNPGTGGYIVIQYVDGAWEGDDLNMTLSPGEAVFVLAPTAFSVNIGGTPVSSVTVAITPGFNFLSRTVARLGTVEGIGTFENILGISPNSIACGAFEFYLFDAQSPYSLGNLPVRPYFFRNGRWSPRPPEAKVGEGVIIKVSQPCSTAGGVNLPTCEITGFWPERICRNTTTPVTFYGTFPVGATIAFDRNGTSPPPPPAPSVPTVPPGGDGFLLTASATLSQNDPYDAVVYNGPECGRLGTPVPPAFTVLTCDPTPRINVRLIGPNKVALGRKNSFGLFYESITTSITPVNVDFRIHCIPLSAIVDYASPYGPNWSPGVGGAPCSAGTAQRLFTVPLISVPPNGNGFSAFGLTIPLGFVPPAFTLYGRSEAPYYDLDTLLVTIVGSQDPNDKMGLVGVGASKSISGLETMPYRIRFENLASATAPAQEVFITDQLDTTKLDLSTFSLGPMFFGSHGVNPPSGLFTYTTDVPFDPDPTVAGDDIIVRINAGVNTSISDPNFGLVTWSFRSIDPATGQLPVDPNRGFLPPNDNPPDGEGSVLFSIKPWSNLVTGDTIGNSASIVFDVNPAILTDTWINTIDKRELALQIARVANTVQVSWTGIGQLESAPFADGPWEDVGEATNPYVDGIIASRFYRLRE
jgi:hypothetical protein